MFSGEKYSCFFAIFSPGDRPAYRCRDLLRILPSAVIVDALEYLVSKGYVNKREVPHPARKLETLATYTINAVGIDLCDGTTKDPGVTIVPEEV
jgi:hypothetical protein